MLTIVEYKRGTTENMPIDQDIEKAREPLIKDRDGEIQSNKVKGKGQSNKYGSVSVVLFSTVVAVCGSFEFGSCVSTREKNGLVICTDLSFARTLNLD